MGFFVVIWKYLLVICIILGITRLLKAEQIRLLTIIVTVLLVFMTFLLIIAFFNENQGVISDVLANVL